MITGRIGIMINENRVRFEAENRGRHSDILLMLMLDEMRRLNGNIEQLLSSQEARTKEKMVTSMDRVVSYKKMNRADLIQHISELIKKENIRHLFPKNWSTRKTDELKGVLKKIERGEV